MTEAQTLSGSLLDPHRFVTLYGTTPPRADAPPERVAAAAERLAERLAGLALDGLVVYDVQDEQERTTEPRPFPFIPTGEPRAYARLLRELSGLQAVTYKCVVNFSEAGWLAWLAEATASYAVPCLSLVGASTPHPAPTALPIDRALELAAAQVGGPTLGGVAIAERHAPGCDESRRLLHKAARGCRYFISQVIYESEPTRRLLADYSAACAAEGVAPRRIVLTFSPCGREKTLAFIKWLGVAISPATERAILDDPAPFSRSIQLCRDNLRQILDQGLGQRLPLGLNIESVSIHRDEIEASIELVHALRETAAEYGLHA
jgi:5,10-methylenetetrahydrofolate reductase